jgi:hypothetical protein
MTALTTDRNTAARSGDRITVPVAAATKIFAGSLVMLDGAVAKPGATAVAKRALGRAAGQVDNSAGANGDLSVDVDRGIFRWGNSEGGEEITIANVGSTAYIVDDQTVAKTDGTGTRSPAGTVVDVDAQGVWVLTGHVEGPLSGSLAAANNLSDVASKPTSRANLGVYEKMGTPAIVVGAQAGADINVTIQLKDSAGADLAVRGHVLAYLSDDANGDSIAGIAPDGGAAIGADGLAIPLVAGKAFQLVSEADGDIDITITESGADTWFLILVMPDGKLVASGAITFV